MSKAVGFFKNIILTNKGKELLLSSNNNIDNSIDFTICKFGDGRYTEDEIPTAIDIKNAWKTQNINTVRIDNSETDPKLIIEITFSNKDMQEPKILNELGIFARDKQGSTHLFAYSLSNVETGEEIEIENDYPTTFKISIISKISNKTNVTNIIDPDGFLTKEVIELLKENIRNIGFRKIKGTLNAGQKVIQVPTDILMPISERAILNIEGEIYFLGRDYTIDTRANTITLKEPYSFNNDSLYEIIDPLPPTYVKEQIQEFIDDFKQLVSDSKVDFEALKERIFLEIQQKVDDFYTQLENYIEENKEKLKGHSIDRIVANGTDENGGNIYDIFRDDDRKIGTITAPQGNEGVGVVDVEYVGLTENGDTEYKQILSNGKRTEHTFISPKGQKGDPFKMTPYPSIAAMEADFETDNVKFGEYAIISSNDDDNAKLYEKRLDGFFFIVQMAMRGKDGVGIENIVSRFDEQKNTIFKFSLQDGRFTDETLVFRGKQGATGGTVGEPQPPGSVPYGTIVEWAGDLPEGWLYTNGTILDKKKYPQMSFLPGITQPVTPKFQLNSSTPYRGSGQIDGFTKYLYTGLDGITCEVWDNSTTSNNYFTNFLNVMREPGKTTKGSYGFVMYGMQGGVIFNLTLNEIMNISYLKINKKNAEGTYTESYITSDKRLIPVVDWYLVIEYMNEEGLWIKGVEIHNKTDFIPLGETISAFMIKSPFKSNKYRIYLDTDKTTFNWNDPSTKVCFIGELELGFDKGGVQYNEYIQLPNEKDNQGRYKIIYVGQPLEIQEPTIYSYNMKNHYNGEVPYSLAVENNLPNHVNGITMTEPQPSRMGYINKYNNNTDTWELVKTHLDKEGYYYDVNGDLKYIPRPYNWYKWDFETHTWIEDTLLKEEAKNELLNKYIELELKKDKMLELKFSAENIEIEIERLKKELEIFNG